MACFYFKQKTTYEMRISDGSSDVCFADLRHGLFVRRHRRVEPGPRIDHMLVVGERLVEARWKHRAELLIEIGDAELDALRLPHQYVDLLNGLLERVQFGAIGRESCRERVCQDV